MFIESPPPRPEPAPDPLPLAIRAATLGVIAAILFAILLFRLWALQVLHTGQYTAAAAASQVRTSDVPAQRGDIVDRHGRVLVSSRTGIAFQVNSATFPADTNCDGIGPHQKAKLLRQPGCLVLSRLAWVIQQPFKKVWKAYKTRVKVNQGYPVVLPFTVSHRQFAYMAERDRRFPWIQFQRTYLRDYPALKAIGPIDPNLIGHVGPITADSLHDPAYRGENLPRIGTVGVAGVEKTYDRYLRGTDGETAQTFDAPDEPVRSPYLVREPLAGDSIRLTLDAHLQRVAQAAVYNGVKIALANQEYHADYGAVVAMDPRNGAIYAMASFPTYSPDVWVPPYTGQNAVIDPNNSLSPQVDKAFAGQYPAGSTFKPITAVAAWMSGLIGPGSQRLCTTSFTSPHDLSHHVFMNWGSVPSTMMSLPQALEISCDTFFYRLGDEFYARHNLQFQEWLRKLGYGSSPPLHFPRARVGPGAGPPSEEEEPLPGPGG